MAALEKSLARSPRNAQGRKKETTPALEAFESGRGFGWGAGHAWREARKKRGGEEEDAGFVRLPRRWNRSGGACASIFKCFQINAGDKEGEKKRKKSPPAALPALVEQHN